jgi:hypothetical protein
MPFTGDSRVLVAFAVPVAFSFFSHFQLALSIVGCADRITRHLNEEQLKQCVDIAIRNALYR